MLYDIENIGNLEKNEKRNLKPHLIKNSVTEYNYKIKKMQEDIEKVNFKESGNSIYYTVPPQNYWSLCTTRDDCICMQIFNCAIVL